MFTYYRDTHDTNDTRAAFGPDPENWREAASFTILTKVMNKHVQMCGNRRHYDRHLVVWEKSKADIAPGEQPTHTLRPGRVELGDPSHNMYETI